MKARGVMIWDPNGVNPYSAEIAAVLLGCEFRVSRWIPSGAVGTTTVPECRDIHLLGTSRDIDGLWSHVARRLVAPLLFIVLAAIKRDVVILCWVRGSYESILFSGASKLLHKCVLVDHNPVPNRNPGTSFDSLARLLRYSVSHRIVHLPGIARNDCHATRYIPHPRYVVWPKHLGVDRRESGWVANPSDGKPVRLLLLGQLRADKGWLTMHKLFEAVDPTLTSFLVVGMGTIPVECMEVVTRRGIELTARTSRQPLSDPAFADAIAESDVLIAPYSNATASGTVMLAYSTGLPTLAFRSGALSDILTDEAMVDPGDYRGFAELINIWRQARFSTYRLSPQELDRRVQDQWYRVASE